MAKKNKTRAALPSPTHVYAWLQPFHTHKGLTYFAFFALAFVLRIAYIFSVRDLPVFETLSMDPAYHHKIALLISNGDWLGGTQPFYRSPLYLYFLGIIYKLFGVDYLTPRIIGALTGAVSVLLIMRISEKLFGFASAFISGIIALFCWLLIYFDGELLTTSFTIMMGLVLLLLFIHALEKPNALRMLGFGFFFGITAITRENYFPIIGLTLLFLIVYGYVTTKNKTAEAKSQQTFLYPALFFIAALVAVSPVTIRNYVVLKDFVPITHYTAVNLYIGNNPYADGRTAIVPFTRGDWYGGIEDVNAITQQAYDRPIKPSDVTAYWSKKTWDYATGNFGHFVGNVAQKFFFIFDLYEYSNNKQLYYFRDLSPLLGFPLFALFSSFGIIPLGLFGLYFAARARNKLILPLCVIMLGYIIGLCLGFVNTRIRMPIIVILIIFSGHAIAQLWREQHRWKTYLPIGLCVIALLLVVNQRPEGHWERSTLAGDFIMGNAYLNRGDYEEAEPYFISSLKLTVSEYSQRSRYALADIAMQRGFAAVQNNDIAAARQAFKSSLDYSETYNAHINYGNIILELEKSPEALRHFLRAIELRPAAPSGYISTALYYAAAGDNEQATRYLQQGKQLLQQQPSNPDSATIRSAISDLESRLRQ